MKAAKPALLVLAVCVAPVSRPAWADFWEDEDGEAPTDVAAIRTALRSDDLWICAEAVQAAAKLGPKAEQLVPELIELLAEYFTPMPVQVTDPDEARAILEYLRSAQTGEPSTSCAHDES